MAISQEQRKKLGLPQQDGPESQSERSPSLERIEEGQEVAPEVAERLQPQMGNQAVQALLSRTASTTQTATGTADFELAEEVGESREEDFEGGSLQFPDMQMGGGGGDGSPVESMPWQVGHLFGGDDEPQKPSKRRKRRRGGGTGGQEPSDDDNFTDDNALPDDDLNHIESTLGQTPRMRDEYRTGDARYRAIEAGLSSPHAIGRRSLVPESLVDRTDHLDPIGRATALGRFLSHAGTSNASRALAKATSQPVSALLQTHSGHAGAAARLASLTVCAQAMEGGGIPTDNATRLALCQDAWPAALEAARTLAQEGRVVAPKIVEQAGEALSSESDSRPRTHTHLDTLTGVRLGAQALREIIPDSPLPIIPAITQYSPPQLNTDPDLATVDAVLQELTGGLSPTDLPLEQRLSAEQVRPVLSATTTLVNAMGQTQVELAAAAIALARVRPGSPARATLVHADRALRQLARTVVRCGDKLHKATGAPITTLKGMPEQTVAQIRSSALAFQALRSWSLNALSEALYR